jgi:NCS1 family nucleobase:cation symporter-1
MGSIIAIMGPVAIKWANRVVVPAQLLVGVIVVIIGLTAVPFELVMNYTPDIAQVVDKNTLAYACVIEAGFAFGISWCASTAVTPRLCRKERDGYWATVGAYGIVTPFFILAGGILGIATLIKSGVMGNDISVMLTQLSGPRMALISLLLVVFANLATQGTGSYLWSIVLKSTFPKASFKFLVIVLGVYAAIFTCWGQLLDHLGAMITIAAFFYGPVMGILFIDYFFVRKRKISLRGAYELEGHDCYVYHKGYNIVGLICVAIGAVSDFLIFDAINYSAKSPIFNYSTATLFGVVLTGIIYLLISKIPAVSKYLLRDRDDITI